MTAQKEKATKTTRRKAAKAAEETPPERVGRGTVKFGDLEFRLDKNINMRLLLALEGNATQEVGLREVLTLFVDFINQHGMLVSPKPRQLTVEELAEQGDDVELGQLIFEWRERTRPNLYGGTVPAGESQN